MTVNDCNNSIKEILNFRASLHRLAVHVLCQIDKTKESSYSVRELLDNQALVDVELSNLLEILEAFRAGL